MRFGREQSRRGGVRLTTQKKGLSVPPDKPQPLCGFRETPCKTPLTDGGRALPLVISNHNYTVTMTAKTRSKKPKFSKDLYLPKYSKPPADADGFTVENQAWFAQATLKGGACG